MYKKQCKGTTELGTFSLSSIRPPAGQVPQIKTNMTSEGRQGGLWSIKILSFNLNEYKKPLPNKCKNPKRVWVYNVWSSVLYSISSVLQDSNVNPESHSESDQVVGMKRRERRINALLPVAFTLLPPPVLWQTSEKKGGHGTWPSHRKVASQIR